MSQKPPFYITTTLPYVNSDPHIGFAMEIIRADVVARYKELTGHEVFFNTGTDEHGVKIYRKAQEAGEDTQGYVDRFAAKFKDLKGLLGLRDDLNFIRTTDTRHKEAAQEFWKRCKTNGYIYKKNYKIKYCVGCELEKTDSELENSRCPIHSNLELEIIEEENYFFKFSEFKDRLLALYKERPNFVVPDFRFNEIKAFVSRGLEDFSISRLKSKMPWGVAVPDDPDQVFYVWFDALVSYISAIGWPHDTEKFEKWWDQSGGVVQYCGKDNLRQQSAMWQAMLMSVGIAPSKQIVIDGFITSGGQKMSKSLGNVIEPATVINEYGAEALRYYCLRELHPFEDSDFTMEKFKEAYNANLANGIGNLTARIMKMAEKNLNEPIATRDEDPLFDTFTAAMEAYDIKRASDVVWEWVGQCDRRIQETEPFKLVKTNREDAVNIITGLVRDLAFIAKALTPLLPQTAEKIKKAIRENRAPAEPLFPRKE